MITVFAPDGIGEVGPATELAAEILAAVAGHPEGPLRSGDVVVVTSKVVSKLEGRQREADDREAAIDEESVGTVARRGPTRIVRTRHGLTLAAAGVDNSNVVAGSVLLLPVDPDASAARLRQALETATGLQLAVVVSDTAGRAWRLGQTDQAIGAAGLRVLERFAGRRDPYGNELLVTATAVADEVAGAADLVKGKLNGRPVAVVRGLAEHLVEQPAPRTVGSATPPPGPSDDTARALVRDRSEDLFRYGSREAVVAAVLAATGQAERYEEALAQPTPAAVAELVVAGSGRRGGEADLLRAVLAAAFGE